MPYIEFFPTGLALTCAALMLILIVLRYFRRRLARKTAN
jgi:hypothetical protein